VPADEDRDRLENDGVSDDDINPDDEDTCR